MDRNWGGGGKSEYVYSILIIIYKKKEIETDKIFAISVLIWKK